MNKHPNPALISLKNFFIDISFSRKDMPLFPSTQKNQAVYSILNGVLSTKGLPPTAFTISAFGATLCMNLPNTP